MPNTGELATFSRLAFLRPFVCRILLPNFPWLFYAMILAWAGASRTDLEIGFREFIFTSLRPGYLFFGGVVIAVVLHELANSHKIRAVLEPAQKRAFWDTGLSPGLSNRLSGFALFCAGAFVVLYLFHFANNQFPGLNNDVLDFASLLGTSFLIFLMLVSTFTLHYLARGGNAREH